MPRKPLGVFRLVALVAAAAAGGVAVGWFLGLVGVPVGVALAWAIKAGPDVECRVTTYCVILGALLGFPLGIVTGLGAAGAQLGMRSRLWPTLGESSAGMLAGIGVWLLARRLPLHGGAFRCHLIYLLPLVFPLVGGVLGYVLNREESRHAAGNP